MPGLVLRGVEREDYVRTDRSRPSGLQHGRQPAQTRELPEVRQMVQSDDGYRPHPPVPSGARSSEIRRGRTRCWPAGPFAPFLRARFSIAFDDVHGVHGRGIVLPHGWRTRRCRSPCRSPLPTGPRSSSSMICSCLPPVVPEHLVVRVVEPGEKETVVVHAARLALVVPPCGASGRLERVEMLPIEFDVHLSDLYHETYLPHPRKAPRFAGWMEMKKAFQGLMLPERLGWLCDLSPGPFRGLPPFSGLPS